MSGKPAAIPLFADAYLADTMHLTTEEHGAYLLLLMAAWRSDDCSLANDDKKLARIAGLSARRWTTIRDTILEFWTVEGVRIFQARLRKERGYVVQKSESNRKNASKRWDKQTTENKQSDESERICDGYAPPPPPPPIEEPIGSSPPEGSTPRKSRDHGTNERSESLNPRATGRNPRAQPKPDSSIPEWVPSEPWNAFLEMRVAQKKPPTNRAISLLIGKLDRLRSSGHDPGAVLDQSTLRNWTDVYEIKDGNHGQNQQSSRDRRDGLERAADRRIPRI